MTSSIRVNSYSSCAFQCAVAETKGLRDSYEDAHAVVLAEQSADLWLLDGHHGDAAARLGAPALAKELGSAMKGDRLPSHERISKSFRTVDNQLRQALKADTDNAKAGSTVVGLLASKQSDGSFKAQLINCGDSRGVVMKGPESPTKANESKAWVASRARRHSDAVIVESVDHKPGHPTEKARIEAAGGSVRASRSDGPLRVDGNLSVSRGLGDFRYKNDRRRPAFEQKVTCTPDIYELSGLQPGTLVVLACDGLWDVMTTKKVASLISAMMTSDTASFNLADIAHHLVSASLKKKSTDNVTVLLAQFGEPDPADDDCKSTQCPSDHESVGSIQ